MLDERSLLMAICKTVTKPSKVSISGLHIGTEFVKPEGLEPPIFAGDYLATTPPIICMQNSNYVTSEQYIIAFHAFLHPSMCFIAPRKHKKCENPTGGI